jgi:predicted 3-demethylubiquinone-9 3-methyltransferase (glyoxalase superfamily)
MATVQKITPHLWFSNEAQEAVRFYMTIFKNSMIGKISYYSKEGYEIHQMPEGSVMSIEFELEGQRFIALNGGPLFKFNESISFVINCETQDEIDYYWHKLTDAGDPAAQQCGWLKDKFGVSWQVVPAILQQLLTNPDQDRKDAVMKALLQMKKIELKKLRQAFDPVGVIQ